MKTIVVKQIKEYDIVNYSAQIGSLLTINLITFKINTNPDALTWMEVTVKYEEQELKSNRFPLRLLKTKQLKHFIQMLHKPEDRDDWYFELRKIDASFKVLPQLHLFFQRNIESDTTNYCGHDDLVLFIFCEDPFNYKTPKIFIPDAPSYWNNFFQMAESFNNDFEKLEQCWEGYWFERKEQVRRQTEQAKRQAEADKEVFDAYVDLAKEYIKLGIKTIEDFAKELGEEINGTIRKAWESAKPEARQ